MTIPINNEGAQERVRRNGLIMIDQNHHDSRATQREMFARETMRSDGGETDLSRVTNNIEDLVVVIGCGGIGSWASIFFGSLRTTKDIMMVDPDTIEMSNLGRTPFNVFQVDDLKVAALAKMLSEKNPSVNTIPIPNFFNEELAEELVNNLNIDRGYRDALIIDCRDDYLADYHLIKKVFPHNRLIRTAYDGSSVTIDFNPQNTPVMGNTGYSVVPSHILPASLAAQLLVIMAMTDTKKMERDQHNAFDTPLTFDSLNLIEYLFTGVMMERLAKNGYGNTNALLEIIKYSKKLSMDTIQQNLPIAPSPEEEAPQDESAPF